jgi:hypothetical protein
VAELVVDALEIVDVEGDQRQRLLRALGQLDFTREQR